MLRAIRFTGAALGAVVAIALASLLGTPSAFFEPRPEATALLAVWILSWVVIGYAILPHVTIEPARWIMRAITDMSTDEFVAAIAGLLIGLLMGFLLGLPLTNLPSPAGLILPVGVSIVLALGMMGLMIAKRYDLRKALVDLGILHPAGGDANAPGQPVTYVDTSAIIDGRIVDIVASGFVSGTLIVPRFVLGELQHIADDSQPNRRSRGRRGLDVLSVLQKDHRVDLELSDEDEPGTPTVDAKLVGLALRRNAGDPDDRLQPQPCRAAPRGPHPQREPARQRAQARVPAR